MAKAVYGKKVITPVGRLQYAYLDKVNDHPEFGSGKYEAYILIPKTEDLSELIKSFNSLAKEAFPDKDPSTIKNRIEDGDTKPENWEGFAGCYAIKAKSKDKPELLNGLKNPISADNFYNGCDVRFKLAPASYVLAGQPGITVYLNGVQKVADNDKFKAPDEVDFPVESGSTETQSDDIPFPNV